MFDAFNTENPQIVWNWSFDIFFFPSCLNIFFKDLEISRATLRWSIPLDFQRKQNIIFTSLTDGYFPPTPFPILIENWATVPSWNGLDDSTIIHAVELYNQSSTWTHYLDTSECTRHLLGAHTHQTRLLHWYSCIVITIYIVIPMTKVL